jgi:hypothetical protein
MSGVIRQAVDAFLKTDPFCPRPYSQDAYAQKLWTVFACRYVATGRNNAAGTSFESLPASFIYGVMDKLASQNALAQGH